MVKKNVVKVVFPQVEPSFGPRHYVPILKSKAGELGALEWTSKAQRANMTPLIEVHGEGKKTLADHSKKVMSNVAGAWGGLPVFIDTLWHGVSGPKSASAAQVIFQAAASENLQFVPVTSLGRSGSYQAVIAIHAIRGVMVRLTPDDFTAQLSSRLTLLLGQLGLNADSVDILIDFGAVGATALQATGIRSLVNALPNLPLWRTLTVAGSSFPPSIAKQPPNQWNGLPRREWMAWSAAVSTAPFPSRLPTYSDYGVRDTAAPPVGFGSSYVNIRYTAGGMYLVRRNTVLVKDGGCPDIYPICNSLRTRPEFYGPGFSTGDDRINATGLQLSTTGNAGSWIQWAMSHHFALVVGEILSLLAA